MSIEDNTQQIQGKLPWEEDLTAEQAVRTRIRKRANKLDGKTWLRYSISIWNDIRKTAEEEALRHPAIFPTQLVTRLIECYTTDEDKVIFDPFVGAGSVVVAAHRVRKTGIGIDIEPKFVEKGLRRLGAVFDETGKVTQDTGSAIYCDDAKNLLKYVSPESIDMVITSPPYWDILMQKRTADYKEIRHSRNSPMTSRYESRTRAYRYIVEQAKKINWDLKPISDGTLADNCYVSLDELVGLKEGISDPSQELVLALKKLFSHVASETEIDCYLITPFLPKK